jgi:hypothetical protein
MTDGNSLGHHGGPPAAAGGYRVEHAFRFGSGLLRAQAGPLVLLTLAQMLAVAALVYLGNLLTLALIPPETYNMTTQRLEGGGGGVFGIRSILTLFFVALALAVGLVLQAGLVRLALELSRGRTLGIGDALRELDRRQVVLASLIIAGLAFVGMILCVVPAVAVLFLTSFALFFVVDHGDDAVTALRSSVRLVGTDPGGLVLFFLAAMALYVVGACLCGLGLLFAVPLVTGAQAYTFRWLTEGPVPR